MIPDAARGRWIVRSATREALVELGSRVHRCFEAGALATGCELTIEPTGPDYADLRPDKTLLRLYRANAEALGRAFPALPPGGVIGAATDMGNVSHVMPTIHPMLGFDCPGAVNHQPEFTAACITPVADRAVLDGATVARRRLTGLGRSPTCSRQGPGSWRCAGPSADPSAPSMSPQLVTPACRPVPGGTRCPSTWACC